MITLQTLLNKRVVTNDGAYLGKVFDFRAESQGSEIVVTHICVGAAAWVNRLRLRGWLRRLFGREREIDLPWEAISVVEDDVRLKPEWDQARCDSCRIQAATTAND